MQLHAVLVPPPDVVEDALEAARGLVPSTPDVADEPRPGLVGRLLGRRQPAAPAAPVVTTALAAPEAVFVRLAKFGNVTASDAAGLARALEAAAGTWRVPEVHVSRLAVADAPPLDVTAQLDGDVDALREIFRNVNEVARLERFFLDRRNFRSELALGAVEVADGAPLPEDVVGAELAHPGRRWSPTHVTLLRTSFTDSGTTFSEVARVQLAAQE